MMLNFTAIADGHQNLGRYVNLDSPLAVHHEAQLVGDLESAGMRTPTQKLRTECVEICTVNFIGQELGRGGRE
jgi:hypothetical protein